MKVVRFYQKLQLPPISKEDMRQMVSGTITDSVERCVARTGAAKAINQAIMKFADSAGEYLHKKK